MRTGFSLVELSIVLVILGLLTGGILTGQNLIRAAELRSVLTDFDKYRSSIMQFKGRYFYLPGDMPNATDFWTGGTYPVANGNGNGRIEYTSPGERFVIWQHLSESGLIEGDYPGSGSNTIAKCGSSGEHIGCNLPKSKLSNAGYVVYFDVSSWIDRNILRLGTNAPGSGGLSDGVLTSQEAWSLDSKIDDGHATQGRFMARSSHPSVGEASCLPTSNQGHDYDLSLDGNICVVQVDLE